MKSFQAKNSLLRLAGFALLCGGLTMGYQNCGSSYSTGSTASSAANNTTTSLPPAVATGPTPQPPGQTTATALAATVVSVTWTDTAGDAKSFIVERAPSETGGPFSTLPASPGPYVKLATVDPSANSYVDNTAMASTTYYYRIVAANSAGNSVAGPQVSATTASAPTTAPAAPSNAVASAAAATIVNVTWADNSNNESSFMIQRATGTATTFTAIAAISANQTSYQDYNLNPGTVYFYRISATNSAGTSAYTANASATTLAAVNTSSFSYVNLNIIGPNCSGCHGSTSPDAGISYANYAATLKTVSAGNSSGSQMFSAISGGTMPPGSPLSSSQSAAIQAWINGGALNN